MQALDTHPDDSGLGVDLDALKPQSKTSPEALVGALLSEASYVGKTKAFGWSGVPEEARLKEADAEKMRRMLSVGESLSQDQVTTLRNSFWRDELMLLALDEINHQKDLPEQREALARRLWVALFTEPAHPEGVEDAFKRAVKNNDASENRNRNPDLGKIGEIEKDVGFTRPGVFRANDVHCVLFAKVWNPETGLTPENKSVWVAARGTENIARPLQSALKTFVSDYFLKAYRNFAKTYKSRYKDSLDAFLNASDSMPEEERPNKMIFCGHSLGGSEATEALIQGKGDLTSRGIKTEGYTFGSPGTGAVGALSIVPTLSIGAVLGLAHAARLLWEKIPGMKPSDGRMSEAASGLQDFSRLVRVKFSKLAVQLTCLPIINVVNRTSQIIANGIDVMENFSIRAPQKSLNTGMIGLGWKGFREKGASDWAQKEGNMTHYAHRRDFVRLVGECAGFDLPGKTALIDTQKSAGGMVKEHSCSMYVDSMQDLLVREKQADHPWMQSLAGCREVINKMLYQQAYLHRESIQAGVEQSFIHQQLKAFANHDPHEASLWIRQSLAKEVLELDRAGQEVGHEHAKVKAVAKVVRKAKYIRKVPFLREPALPATTDNSTDPAVLQTDRSKPIVPLDRQTQTELNAQIEINKGLSLKQLPQYLTKAESFKIKDLASRNQEFLDIVPADLKLMQQAMTRSEINRLQILQAKRYFEMEYVDRVSGIAAKKLAVGKSRLSLAVDNTQPVLEGALIGHTELIQDMKGLEASNSKIMPTNLTVRKGSFMDRLAKTRALKEQSENAKDVNNTDEAKLSSLKLGG